MLVWSLGWNHLWPIYQTSTNLMVESSNFGNRTIVRDIAGHYEDITIRQLLYLNFSADKMITHVWVIKFTMCIGYTDHFEIFIQVGRRIDFSKRMKPSFSFANLLSSRSMKFCILFALTWSQYSFSMRRSGTLFEVTAKFWYIAENRWEIATNERESDKSWTGVFRRPDGSHPQQ